MTKDEGIDHIARMMCSGQWQGAKSRRELAAEWGAHDRTLATWAEAASAVIARQGGPMEQFVTEKIAELEHIKETAMAAGESRDAINAIKLMAEMKGAIGRGQLRNAKPAEPVEDKYASATREERIAMLKAALAEEEAGKDGMH